MTDVRKKKVIRIGLAALGVVLATSAVAQLSGPRGHEHFFMRADLDGNGAVSKSEAFATQQDKFRSADTDASGEVSRDEMIEAIMRKVAVHAAKRFDRADRNGDGRISEAEFSAVMDKRFSKIDTDSDGEVTREELRETIRAHRAGRYEREIE